MENKNAMVPVSAGFEPVSLAEAQHLSQTLSQSSIIPGALRGKPADVLVTLMTGRELGLGPMQSLRGIYVIDGKGVASSDLIVGLVKRSNVCKFFRLVESTDKVATYETHREGEEPTRMSFTIEQAQTAGLAGRNNWAKYPAAMLRARCSAALARAVYPDVAMGLYDVDEAEDFRRPRPADVRPIQAAPEVPAQNFTAPPPPQQEIAEGEIVQEPVDPVAYWHHRIEEAGSSDELEGVGRELAARFPKGHPIRAEVSAHYSTRSGQLRRAS